MEKRWIYKPIPESEQIEHLSTHINVNPILASILIQRNYTNFEEAKDFFRPSLKRLHDPFLMKDMEKAIDRLNMAITNEEKILIYGDYDVDGTTSVATVYGFLKTQYANIDYYIPDRYKEGYGISPESIRWAVKKGFKLIICLDCGIKAVNLIKEAKAKGIDFIVCDHHLPGSTLPPAVAILDPKQKDCSYPFDELTGCGVGFKLIQAYCLRNKIEESQIFEYLDLISVSIASDLVPIVGENRILAYHGLIKLNENPCPGLKALISISGLKEIDISSIVFGIGPRINAAGRIAHAKAAVNLLQSKDQEEVDLTAEKINNNNITRRNFDSNITKEALKLIEDDQDLKSAKSTVLFKSDWHKGVIGIVASRCIEKYYRPTIILTESNNKATGSARSVVGFDVYEAIVQCSDLLEQYGGHKYAAGLTLSLDKLKAFQTKFEEIVSQTITDEQLIPQLEIDQMINFDRINFKFYNILKQMSPFGPQNMAPVFVSENVYVDRSPRILKNEHLKMFVKQEGYPYTVEAIGFGLAKYFEMINSGMRFKAAYTIEAANYFSSKYLRLNLKDIKFD